MQRLLVRAASTMASNAAKYGHAKVLRIVDIVPGKLSKEVIREGVSPETPKKGAHISCQYVGKLMDGSDFDSSRKRGRPFQFEIGQGRVIKVRACACCASSRGCFGERAAGRSGTKPGSGRPEHTTPGRSLFPTGAVSRIKDDALTRLCGELNLEIFQPTRKS